MFGARSARGLPDAPASGATLSKMVTLIPRLASVQAVSSPATPVPITTVWLRALDKVSCLDNAGI